MKLFWALRLLAKSLVKKLRLAGLVSLIEYCDDCGRRQPLIWYAADDLWFSVTGSPGGVLCPECFDRRARLRLRRGIVRWTPTWEPQQDTSTMPRR